MWDILDKNKKYIFLNQNPCNPILESYTLENAIKENK
tara:strand:- start:158 stop:268 length:111 start_codon:yes stop_codon:yes gene_type:complete